MRRVFSVAAISRSGNCKKLAAQLAALTGDHDGHVLLLLLGKSGQIRIAQQIGAVVMIVLVRDGLADLVGQCCAL